MNKEDLKYALQTINLYYNELSMRVEVHDNYTLTISDYMSGAEIRAYETGSNESLALILTGMLEVIRVMQY